MKPIEIGYVSKVHGLGGELKITLHWEQSDALQVGKQLELRPRESHAEPVRMDLAGLRGATGGRLARFAEVTTREQAERFKGATVWIDRDQLAPLADGEYYLSDLVGAEVSAADGPVGKVVRIAFYPTVDALVIATDGDILLEQPLLEEWIEEVDAVAQRVVLKSRDGLF